MTVKSYYECPESGTIYNFDNIVFILPNKFGYLTVCYYPERGVVHSVINPETGEETLTTNLPDMSYASLHDLEIIKAFKEYKNSKDSCPACEKRNKKLMELL